MCLCVYVLKYKRLPSSYFDTYPYFVKFQNYLRRPVSTYAFILKIPVCEDAKPSWRVNLTK